MIDTNSSRMAGESCAERPPSALAPATVIPSEPVKLELYRLWKQNLKWLIALGCPDRRPLPEGDHLTFFDTDHKLAIAHDAPGLVRLVWATAGNGSRESLCASSEYASFELPNGQIVSLDLRRGTDLWVSFSDSSYQEALKLAAWLDACRTFDLQWRIQGVAL